MTLTLSDPDGKVSDIPLFAPQESRSVAEGEVDVYPYPGNKSDETVLLSLDAGEKVDLSGITTSPRLVSDNSWPDDPLDAIAEWAAQFESVVNGGQGTGYEITNDDRDRTVGGFIEQVSWQRFSGEPYEVHWNLSMMRGGVIDSDLSVDMPSTDPDTSLIISGDGVSVALDTPENVMVERQQGTEYYPIPQYSDPDYDANEVVAIEGVTRRVSITGDVSGDAEVRNDFDEVLRGLVGGNQTVTIQTAFPGYNLSGALENYDSIREAGMTQIGRYRLSIVEGELTSEEPDPTDPAFFEVTITSHPSSISQGSTGSYDYTLENTGDVAGVKDVWLEVSHEDELEYTEVDRDEDITLGDGTSITLTNDSTTGTLSWDTSGFETGEYSVRVRTLDDIESRTTEVSD